MEHSYEILIGLIIIVASIGTVAIAVLIENFITEIENRKIKTQNHEQRSTSIQGKFSNQRDKSLNHLTSKINIL